MSFFSRLPGRVVIPLRRHRRIASPQLVVSFAIAIALVTFATIVGGFLDGIQ